MAAVASEEASSDEGDRSKGMTNGNETSRRCGYDRLVKRDSFDSMSNRGERSVRRRGFFE